MEITVAIIPHKETDLLIASITALEKCKEGFQAWHITYMTAAKGGIMITHADGRS